MSRFFARHSDSDSETESSEDDDRQQKQPVVTKAYLPSDDEEETKRVVRSGKDKSYDELRNILKIMKNHEKIKDMSKVLTDFEELTKAFDKAKKVIEKEGIPRFYLRAIVELETFVNALWDDLEGRKAMSKSNSKGLTSLRQKIRKYNKNFETEITAYKESPDAGESEQEEEKVRDEESESGSEDEDDDEVPVKKPSATKAAPAAAADSEGESDDSWIQSESESSSSDDEKRPMGTLTADFFRKKVVPEAELKKKKEKEEKKKKEREQRKAREAEEDEEGDTGEGWTAVPTAGGPSVGMVQERPKIFAKDVEINHDVVCKKLAELLSGRGKKGTDRSLQIDMLIELREITKANALGDAIDCKVLFGVISSIFDYNPNIAASMKGEMWEKCLEYIEELLGLLIANKDTIIVKDYALDEDVDNFATGPPYRIRGCALTVIERMDDEFTKMLQACDAHSTEYIDRLKDETRICKLIDDLVENYMKDQKASDEELCRAYIKRIQHLYYKFDPTSQVTLTNGPGSATTGGDGKSYQVMERLCKFIYTKDQSDRIRTRALLSHVYHLALHDRWFQARDLMLMSHRQDTINQYDIPTQILYNRAMVQLGICAFRQGFISQAHNCLVDIQSSGRAKELLAQGLLLQRQHERTAEQEKIEKRRQMPYHMHINLELLECVYLISAMLLEIPYMAAHEFDARRRMISKNFHHVLRVSDRQTLVGPPESMREHVVAACKAMKVGDWKSCANYIINDKMNTKVWDLFYNADGVREMLKQKIQEESLRTYLFSYSSVYDSLSLTMLAEMFDIEKSVVHSTISKMIISEELMASLDEPTQTVVMHRTEPSRLQSLALQLSEKVAFLVEHNEKTLEMKSAGPGYFNYQRQGGNQDRTGGGQGGMMGGGGYQQQGERSGQYQQNSYSGGRGRGGRGGGGRYQGNRRQQGQQSYYNRDREQEA